MPSEWFVRKGDRMAGPFSSAELKKLADQAKVTPDTLVRLGQDGTWSPASKVKGLFTAKPEPKVGQLVSSTAPKPIARPTAPPPAPTPTPSVPASATSKVPCPFCGEDIAARAIKCRHCNEFLDGRPSTTQQAPQFVTVAPQPVNVVINNQQTTVVGGRQKRWDRGVAIFLSLILPGLGQLYKGQIINGLVWFVVVAIGYAMLILPGVILHLLCIMGAGLGDPYR